MEKHDALNNANIQSRASVQSVWSANGQSLVLLVLLFHDSPLSEETLLTEYARRQRKKCEKQIRITFDVLNTRHEFLLRIQSIFALKNNFRLIQITQEGWFTVY